MMHNFKIVNNERQCKVCLHPYKLTFIVFIVVGEEDLPNMPLKSYNLLILMISYEFSKRAYVVGKFDNIIWIGCFINKFFTQKFLVLDN